MRHTHTDALRGLAGDLLTPVQLKRLDSIINASPLDFQALFGFDCDLGWGSMGHVSSGTIGNYSIDDRDVFRPIQYCQMHFAKMSKHTDGAWLSRHIVHMASLHIESLVQRIGLVHRLPLGRAIREKVFRAKVDGQTWDRLERFRHIYNDAKHNVGHQKDTHLFSQVDAMLAYVVCRRLGQDLHHLANLSTDWAAQGESPPSP